MADDIGVTPGSGKMLRARDLGTGSALAQQIDVAPWLPTVLGAQWALIAPVASAVSASVPSFATHALISVESGAARYTDNGAQPSVGALGTGHLLMPGFLGELAIPGGRATPLRFCSASSGATAILGISYRRYV